MRAAVLALAFFASGCALDFSGFQPRKDAAVDRFTPADASVDDASFDASTPDVIVAQPDHVTVDRAVPACGLTGGHIRLAHMATGVGAVHLCTRSRQNPRWIDVVGADWTRPTIEFGQVTTYVSLPEVVTTRNNPREFLVLRDAQSCEGVENITQGVASQMVQLDPSSVGMLLLVTQSVQSDSPIAVLNFLDEKVCTDCGPQAIEVRSIHAAYGAPYFLDFSFSSATLNQLANRGAGLETRFGRNVGYGASMPGSDGYDCNAAWAAVARAPVPISAEFVVRDPVGNEVARGIPSALKTELLLRSRLATIFYAGAPDLGGLAQETLFVVCYEGESDGGIALCDRIRALPPPVVEDAATPADASADTGSPTDDDDASALDETNAPNPQNG
jgi:hypothetical protein